MTGLSARLRPLRAALELLTPLGRARDAPSRSAMAWFPVAGACIGALDGLAWQLARRVLEPLPAGVAAAAADAVLTGALHLDGLADTADGCLAHVPARARLDIMATPEVGAFGTVALALALATRSSALATQPPSLALSVALGAASRSLMAGATTTMAYARPGGLVTAFLPSPATAGEPSPAGPATAADPVPADPVPADPVPADPVPAAVAAGIAGALLVAGAGGGRRAVEAVAAGSAAALVVLGAAERRLGGYTGDVLGAAGVACEAVGLLVAGRRRVRRVRRDRRARRRPCPVGR